jgi:putative heme transporter
MVAAPSLADSTRMPRRRVLPLVRLAIAAAIVAGAGVAVYAERATMRSGLAVLPHTQADWVAAGIGAECVSMAALAQLERRLLRAGGADLTLPTMLATAYTSNAISVAVPVVGASLATAYSYRALRRYGAAAELAGVALTVSGIFSTIAFAVVAAAGALLSGNPAAAWVALGGGTALAAVAATALLAMRFTWARTALEVPAATALRLSRWLAHRIARRPAGTSGPEPRQLVASALQRAGELRLGYRAAIAGLAYALLNWLADVACLICALYAVRAAVPWHDILLSWTAGSGAGSLTPVPAGLGVVDLVLIAALSKAGLRTAVAVAAVLLYRVITFKIAVTIVWVTARWLRARHKPTPTRPTEGGDSRDLPHPYSRQVPQAPS